MIRRSRCHEISFCLGFLSLEIWHCPSELEYCFLYSVTVLPIYFVHWIFPHMFQRYVQCIHTYVYREKCLYQRKKTNKFSLTTSLINSNLFIFETRCELDLLRFIFHNSYSSIVPVVLQMHFNVLAFL